MAVPFSKKIGESKILIPPSSGIAFVLKKEQKLKVTDVMGEQVADLFCFNETEREESLSSGRSIDYNETIYLTKGHKLYSNRSRVMFEIIEDSVGRHDFLVTPCSLEMFEMVTGSQNYHPSCEENLANAFQEFKIPRHLISTTFNVFMNIEVSREGQIHILPPCSKAGDSLLLLAKMDLIVGVTACSDEQTNHGKLKPIVVEIN